MNLTGKIALVTGGSKGIGRSIAVELAKAGASIMINYSKDEEAAEETLKIIKAIGGYGTSFKADVSNYEQCEELINKTINTFGKIDILVNNAGISEVGLFIDLEKEKIQNMININLLGYINTCHLTVPKMLMRGEGTIVNISSVWGNVGASCEVIYSATKGAINSFTKALAKELGPSNIRVNAISPGIIETGMNAWLSEEEKEEIIEEIPLNKIGHVEDVANLVVFLCSNHSKYITGQIITVDGGWS